MAEIIHCEYQRYENPRSVSEALGVVDEVNLVFSVINNEKIENILFNTIL